MPLSPILINRGYQKFDFTRQGLKHTTSGIKAFSTFVPQFSSQELQLSEYDRECYFRYMHIILERPREQRIVGNQEGVHLKHGR